MKKIKRRFLTEGQKPKMVEELEQMFGLGEHTWDAGPNFRPNRLHLIGMFDIINRHVFDNTLDRTEKKEVVESSSDPSLKNTLAGFSHGNVDGMEHKIIVVRHPVNSNFFNVVCSLIHEMIHLKDYMNGPMGFMLREKLMVGQLDWGAGYFDTIDQSLADAGLKRSQLPDDMPDFDTSTKQYCFPEFKNKVAAAVALKTGLYRDCDKPEKYKLAFNSMYDVHGSFFRGYAEKANRFGFDVTETFDVWRPHVLRKTWESLEDKNVPPWLIAAVKSLKSKDRIAYEYRDPKNWGIEIF